METRWDWSELRALLWATAGVEWEELLCPVEAGAEGVGGTESGEIP